MTWQPDNPTRYAVVELLTEQLREPAFNDEDLETAKKRLLTNYEKAKGVEQKEKIVVDSYDMLL